jgi:hypothetical protein
MKIYSKITVISLTIFTMLGCTTTSDAPVVEGSDNLLLII